MNFYKAYTLMLSGFAVKLPNWDNGSYWYLKDEVIMIHTQKEKDHTIDDSTCDAGILALLKMTSWIVAGEVSQSTITFGIDIAIMLLRQGMKVMRTGWNGKNQYVTILPAGNAIFQRYEMQDCLALKNAQDLMQPGWVPSQGDLLADDWTVYYEPVDSIDAWERDREIIGQVLYDDHIENIHTMIKDQMLLGDMVRVFGFRGYEDKVPSNQIRMFSTPIKPKKPIGGTS